MDDQSLSAKFEDDQKREALVVGGWWMVGFVRKGNFENGVMCLCDAWRRRGQGSPTQPSLTYCRARSAMIGCVLC